MREVKEEEKGQLLAHTNHSQGSTQEPPETRW
jgi:hypothetical protein